MDTRARVCSLVRASTSVRSAVSGPVIAFSDDAVVRGAVQGDKGAIARETWQLDLQTVYPERRQCGRWCPGGSERGRRSGGGEGEVEARVVAAGQAEAEGGHDCGRGRGPGGADKQTGVSQPSPRRRPGRDSSSAQQATALDSVARPQVQWSQWQVQPDHPPAVHLLTARPDRLAQRPLRTATLDAFATIIDAAAVSRVWAGKRDAADVGLSRVDAAAGAGPALAQGAGPDVIAPFQCWRRLDIGPAAGPAAPAVGLPGLSTP